MSSSMPDATLRGVLSAFLTSTPDYVLVLTSPDGMIQNWLGAAQRVTGYAPQEVIGRSLSLLFTPEDQQLGLDIHEISVARTQGRSEDDRWHVRKDGSRFWASGVLTAVKDGQGAIVGLCKLLRDKTDVRMQMQSLEAKVAYREAAIEQHKNFLTTTAHELRNPLSPIGSALALLSRPDAAKFSAKALMILENQVRVLQTLIDDLANVDRPNGCGVALQLRPVNLNESLSTVVDTFQSQATAEGKTLLVLLPATDLWIQADAARVQQIFLNLLNNAFKYTRRGGRISVSATVEACMAIVRIEDDGVGISADVLPHIFELFTRELRHADIRGLGVGLSVVQELAVLHGGNIEARSQGQDKGSVFGLRLPLIRNQRSLEL